MVQRIALALVVLVGLVGSAHDVHAVGSRSFMRPDIPGDSRAVYRFGGYSGAALRTLNGGIFSLAVGFKKRDRLSRRDSHRDRARALVSRLEDALSRFDEDGVSISVQRIYVPTREIILTVDVSDSTRLERVRSELTQLLRSRPETAFVGTPGKVSAID